MKIGIGLGQGRDPALAAVRAVRQARKSVSKPTFALAFGSIHYNQKKVHKALCREIDPGILMGGTSYAEITNAGVTQNSVAVLLAEFDKAPVRFATVENAATPYETGRALGAGLDGARADRPVGLLFTSFAAGLENETLRGLIDSAGRFPVFGGMACMNYDLGMAHPDFPVTWQYAGGKLTRHSARLALLDLPEPEFRVGFGFEHGWDPVGPPVELTRCEGNRVFEVNGVPVFDYYRQFLGRDVSDKFFESMIQRFAFSVLVGGNGLQRSVLKLPVACDFQAGCVTYFPAEDLQSRRVQMIQASRAGLVNGAGQAARRCLDALGGATPSLVLVVSCCTRGAILHSRLELEWKAIRDVFGPNVPVFGYYSGGEIVPFLNRYPDIVDPKQDLSGSHYHTTTVGLLALAGPRPARASVPRPGRARPKETAARLEALLAKSEETLEITESFLANMNRKSYRDGEQLRKQSEVIHRYTPHGVWKEVGTRAARGEYELPDGEFHGAFLFMDVQGFTAYSEKNRPEEVVHALNRIFDPATRIIYECSGDVDKYIGDCIFAAFPTAADAVRAGKRILGLLDALKREGHPFSLRIGIHSGRAVRANVGSESRREYTYIGDAVNLTQRLESQCAPGRLLVSEAVYRDASADLPGAARLELLVKGKKERVVAFEFAPSGGGGENG